MENFMTTILMHTQNLEFLKKHFRVLYPKVGSSHLTEAIAVGLGFNKHASLLAALKHPISYLHAVQFSYEKFELRLKQLAETTENDNAESSQQLKQHQLPIPCWHQNQSNAVYHRYSRLGLPIIFIKNRKRKYCSLDYDYHSWNITRTSEALDMAAITRMLFEFERLIKRLEMPKVSFYGKITTGEVKNLELTNAETFADAFALVYFSVLRDVETKVSELYPPKAA
jgi:hypothetical protein